MLALLLVGQGVVQNFSAYKDVTTVETLTYQKPKVDADGNPVKDAAGNPVTETRTTQKQTLPMGPMASQESDQGARHQRRRLRQRQLRASVRESDAAVELPGDVRDPADSGGADLHVRAHGGRYAPGLGGVRGDGRSCSCRSSGIAVHSEQQGNPLHRRSWASIRRASALQPGGNMEGKEARFGIAASALFATVTTATSCGAVNAMHDSFTPLGGFVPLFNMQLGEVVFGGVGTGLYSHADLRHRRRLHRRADDRPHAGVPRQEDRGLRDEDELDRHPGHAAASCWSAPRSR